MDYTATPRAVIVGTRSTPVGIIECALDAYGLGRAEVVDMCAFGAGSTTSSAAILILDGSELADEDLEAALARAMLATGSGTDRGLIGIIRPDQVDIATYRTLGTRVALLCDAGEEDWPIAIHDVLPHKRRRLSESGSDDVQGSLDRLVREVADLAGRSAKLAAEDLSPPPDMGALDLEDTLARVRAAIKTRQVRQRWFPSGLLADPAWDMLLGLFVSDLEGKKLSTSNLCLAANVPNTTALRWIGVLHDSKLIERYPNPLDKRMTMVALTPSARSAMLNYCAEIQRLNLSMD